MGRRTLQPPQIIIYENTQDETAVLEQEHHAVRRTQHRHTRRMKLKEHHHLDVDNVDPVEITDIHHKPRVWPYYQRNRKPLAVLSSNVKYPRGACELHSRCKTICHDVHHFFDIIRAHHTTLLALYPKCRPRRPMVPPDSTGGPPSWEHGLIGGYGPCNTCMKTG